MTKAEVIQAWGERGLRYVEAAERLQGLMSRHVAGADHEAAIMQAAAQLGERRVAWDRATDEMMAVVGGGQAWATFYVETPIGIDALEVAVESGRPRARLRRVYQAHEGRG